MIIIRFWWSAHLPSPKPILTLSSHLGQNVGLWVGWLWVLGLMFRLGGHFPSNLWRVEHTTWKRVACLIFHRWSQASASFATAARFRIVTQSRTCLHSIATSWIALRKLAPRRVTTIDCCRTKKGKSVSMLTYTFKVILRFCLNSSSLPLRERTYVSAAQDRAKIITKYTQLSFPILRTLKERFVFGNLTMFDFILQSIFIFTFERQRYALTVKI